MITLYLFFILGLHSKTETPGPTQEKNGFACVGEIIVITMLEFNGSI